MNILREMLETLFLSDVLLQTEKNSQRVFCFSHVLNNSFLIKLTKLEHLCKKIIALEK